MISQLKSSRILLLIMGLLVSGCHHNGNYKYNLSACSELSVARTKAGEAFKVLERAEATPDALLFDVLKVDSTYFNYRVFYAKYGNFSRVISFHDLDKLSELLSISMKGVASENVTKMFYVILYYLCQSSNDSVLIESLEHASKYISIHYNELDSDSLIKVKELMYPPKIEEDPDHNWVLSFVQGGYNGSIYHSSYSGSIMNDDYRVNSFTTKKVFDINRDNNPPAPSESASAKTPDSKE